MSRRSEAVRALQQSWRAEKESAQTYRDLAAVERDEKRKQILLRMAEAEEHHAARWASRLQAEGAAPPTVRDTLRTRWLRFLSRASGTEATIRRMEAQEGRDAARYAAQREAALGHDEESARILREVEREEKSHARALKQMVPALGPQTTLDYLFRRERWHGRGGGWISDAIYGVNDGLGAVFGIVSGVAGATTNNQHFILISGLAATLASALSMGSGAYLAVKAEREVHEAELSREQRELDESPEEEMEEMALFYQLQGFEEEQSRSMAQQLATNPEQMLKTMAQAELGLSEDRLPDQWVSALSASLSTAVGAFIPIVPFFFLQGIPAVLAAAGISLAAHFAVGAAKTIVTTRSWFWSGVEMTLVGAVEGLITYGLGRAFGSLG